LSVFASYHKHILRKLIINLNGCDHHCSTRGAYISNAHCLFIHKEIEKLPVLLVTGATILQVNPSNTYDQPNFQFHVRDTP
jgi:hypothetical protein